MNKGRDWPTKRTGSIGILDGSLPTGQVSDYIHPKCRSTVFEVVTKGDDYIIQDSFLDEVHR